MNSNHKNKMLEILCSKSSEVKPGSGGRVHSVDRGEGQSLAPWKFRGEGERLSVPRTLRTSGPLTWGGGGSGM